MPPHQMFCLEHKRRTMEKKKQIFKVRNIKEEPLAGVNKKKYARLLEPNRAREKPTNYTSALSSSLINLYSVCTAVSRGQRGRQREGETERGGVWRWHVCVLMCMWLSQNAGCPREGLLTACSLAAPVILFPTTEERCTDRNSKIRREKQFMCVGDMFVQRSKSCHAYHLLLGAEEAG